MANDLQAAAGTWSAFRAIRLHRWSCHAVAIVIWCAIAGAGTAGAQSIGSGTIHGTVKGNTGGALSGVTITLSGPALLVKPIVDTSQADGNYRFVDFPPGPSLMLAAGILGGSPNTSADAAVSITVRPAVALNGGHAQLRVLVARNDMNRALVWEVDGPSYYRLSSIELRGASAPRRYVFTVRDLPAGEFEVRATVKRNDSSEITDRSTIKVVGPEE
jgi:hypothetical protein